MVHILIKLYGVISFATFIYLTLFDGYAYTFWNWIIVVPINFSLSMIWPVYWGILHWVF